MCLWMHLRDRLIARGGGFDDWVLTRQSGSFEIVEQVAQAFRSFGMPRRHGVLDALRGSVTEQVLRRAECPLLAVPV